MKKIAATAALTFCLALPASAAARTFTHEGRIVDDPETRVTLDVRVRGGHPRRVTDVKARRVLAICGKRRQRERITFTLLDPLRVGRDNTFGRRLSDGEGGVLTIRGRVRRHGRATVGSIETNRFRSHSGSSKGQLCRVPRQRFRTSKA